jgi:hypothetical protein
MSEPTKANPIRAALHDIIGLGRRSERKSILQSPLGPTLHVPQTIAESEKKLSSATQNSIAGIVAERTEHAGASANELLDSIKNSADHDIDVMSSILNAVNGFPSKMGGRPDDAIINKKIDAQNSVEQLVLLRDHLHRTCKFLIENPLLPDVGRIEYIKEFGKEAQSKKIDWADDVRRLVDLIAKKALLSLPEVDSRVSEAFGKPELLNEIKKNLTDPEFAARKAFASLNLKDDINLGDFHLLARGVELVGEGDKIDFKKQMETTSKQIVLNLMSSYTREEHERYAAQLSKFAQAVRDEARRVTREQMNDMQIASSMDINDIAAIKKGIAAMKRVKHRNVDDFKQIGQGFRSKFVEFETKRQQREPSFPDLPAIIGVDYIQHRLPEFRKVTVETSIAQFLNESRHDLNSAETNTMVQSLAFGDSFPPYNERIGSNNTYDHQARRLKDKLLHQDDPLGLLPLKRPTWDAKPTNDLDNLIESRRADFNELREKLATDIRRMLDWDTYTLHEGYLALTIARIKQVEQGSEEMGLHFKNAFVYAWEHKAQLGLKLSLKPEQTFSVTIDSPEEARRHERHLARGLSLGR